MSTLKRTVAALVLCGGLSAPAWLPLSASARPNRQGSVPGRALGHRGRPQEKANSRHGKGKANQKACQAHAVAYVAFGKLVSDTLTRNANGSYSGTLTVEVVHTNHHAAADRGKTVTYTLSEVRVTLGFKGTEGKAPSTEEVKAGDRTKVLGRITFLPKRCSKEGFSPTVTVKHVIFHNA